MTLNEIIELLLSTMDRVPYCVTSCDSLHWNVIIELLLSAMDRVLLFNFRWGGGAKNHLTGTAHLTKVTHYSNAISMYDPSPHYILLAHNNYMFSAMHFELTLKCDITSIHT